MIDRFYTDNCKYFVKFEPENVKGSLNPKWKILISGGFLLYPHQLCYSDLAIKKLSLTPQLIGMACGLEASCEFSENLNTKSIFVI